METIVRRLLPGSDLKRELESMVADSGVQSAVVLSLVGSLSAATLRLAGAAAANCIAGPLEIVAATGTLSQSGLHIHIAVAGVDGIARGGHLLPGCTVNTTVEAIICDMSDRWHFERIADEATGYKELVARSSEKVV